MIVENKLVKRNAKRDRSRKQSKLQLQRKVHGYLALTRPQSTTCFMPRIVTEVSAIFVDTITFLEPCTYGTKFTEIYGFVVHSGAHTEIN